MGTRIEVGYDVKGETYYVEGYADVFDITDDGDYPGEYDWNVYVEKVEKYDDHGNTTPVENWQDDVAEWTAVLANEIEHDEIAEKMAEEQQAAEDAYYDTKMEMRRMGEL